MPTLFLDRLPLPSLQAYTVFSLIPLSCSIYYAIQVTSQPGWRSNGNVTTEPSNESVLDAVNRSQINDTSSGGFSPAEVLYYMIEEPLCIWTLINMAYCCLILFGKVIQKLVFGELRISEQQHIRDKFWNFVFYKFIFIFGVINVQFMDEVVLWCSWFSVLGFLHLLAQLCKDRFEYLSSSPTTPKWTHIRLFSLLVGIMITSCVLSVICIFVGLHAGINTFAFMAAECVLVNLRTLFVIVRYIIHLWDINHEGVWENRGTYVYYTELIFELVALIVDFCHHIHMLLWGNIFLSMASLVICMQIRHMFYEIQRQIKKHKNYRRVIRHMENNYPMGTADELAANSDDCAICWDKMESARKLPCGHLFHNSCLRSWLEQDTSCPTCRKSLASPSEDRPGAVDNPDTSGNNLLSGPLAGPAVPPDVQQNRTTTNHFFHFDGSRYVSWLPSFSVEVTHTQLMNRPHHIQTSQLDNMARQVQQMFPNMPLNIITDDLRATRSIEVTIENILDERLVPPPFQMQGSRSSSHVSESPLLDNVSNSSSASSSADSDSNSTSSSSENEDLNRLLSDEIQNLSVDESDHESYMNIEPQLVNGSRFSKSPRERERMLAHRKEELIRQAKKRYISKFFYNNGSKSQLEETEPGPSGSRLKDDSSSIEDKRYLAYEAARRRLKRSDDDT